MSETDRVQRRVERLKAARPAVRPVRPEWQAYVDRVAADAPPLSKGQADKLSLLIRPRVQK